MLFSNRGDRNVREHSRKVVFVVQDTIVRWTRRSQETCVTLKIKVKLRGMDDFAVDHSASWTISTVVCILAAGREKSDVMSLPNDDDGDSRVDIHFLARSCEPSKNNT